MSRATLPPVISHWKPELSDSENGSSKPSRLPHSLEVNTHSNRSGSTWRIPSLRLPTRRFKRQLPTDSSHISLCSATSRRSPVTRAFTNCLNSCTSDRLKSKSRISGHSGDPWGRYSSFTAVNTTLPHHGLNRIDVSPQAHGITVILECASTSM